MLVMIKKVMNYAGPHPCFRVSWIYKFGRLISVLHGLKNNLLISFILIPYIIDDSHCIFIEVGVYFFFSVMACYYTLTPNPTPRLFL